MGLHISTPIQEWDSDDLADGLISLGEEYALYADAVLDHRLDGSVLATLLPGEIKETLRDLGIRDRLHRKSLQKKLLELLYGPMDQSSAMNISRSLSTSASSSASNDLSRSNAQGVSRWESSGSKDCRRRRRSSTKSREKRESIIEELDSMSEDDQGLIQAFLTATAEQQKQEWKALQARQLALQKQVDALSAQ